MSPTHSKTSNLHVTSKFLVKDQSHNSSVVITRLILMYALLRHLQWQMVSNLICLKRYTACYQQDLVMVIWKNLCRRFLSCLIVGCLRSVIENMRVLIKNGNICQFKFCGMSRRGFAHAYSWRNLVGIAFGLFYKLYDLFVFSSNKHYYYVNK